MRKSLRCVFDNELAHRKPRTGRRIEALKAELGPVDASTEPVLSFGSAEAKLTTTEPIRQMNGMLRTPGQGDEAHVRSRRLLQPLRALHPDRTVDRATLRL